MKFIRFIRKVNKKTDGMFYMLLFVLVDLILTSIMVYHGVIFERKTSGSSGEIIVFDILRSILIFVVNFVIIIFTGILGHLVYQIYYWFVNHLFVAFKEAAQEDYNIDSSNKSKIKFK